MTFENLIGLIIIAGLGYMMFRGGGCCGSHGVHRDHNEKGNEENER